jgi:hypothetical protein
MAADFDFCRAKWATDAASYPAVTCPQPQGRVVSFTFHSSWGGSSCEIQQLLVQNENGDVIDTLISDKWYLNSDLFPDSISFPLSTLERPSLIIIENGVAQKGIRRLVVVYDDKQIWTGDIPMGTSESAVFTIPVPVPAPPAEIEFQRPDIKKFRSTKSIPFPIDGV